MFQPGQRIYIHDGYKEYYGTFSHYADNAFSQNVVYVKSEEKEPHWWSPQYCYSSKFAYLVKRRLGLI